MIQPKTFCFLLRKVGCLNAKSYIKWNQCQIKLNFLPIRHCAANIVLIDCSFSLIIKVKGDIHIETSRMISDTCMFVCFCLYNWGYEYVWSVVYLCHTWKCGPTFTVHFLPSWALGNEWSSSTGKTLLSPWWPVTKTSPYILILKWC